MSAYWANARLMFQMIGAFGKPTLVNLEPDFWGFAQDQASGGDPTKLFAYVNSNPDCANLSNDIVGIAGCLLAMGHKLSLIHISSCSQRCAPGWAGRCCCRSCCCRPGLGRSSGSR